jgi:hypothetical protein
MSDYGGRVLIVDLLGNSNDNAGIFLDTFGNDFSVIPLDAIDPLAFDKAYRKVSSAIRQGIVALSD